MSRQLCETVGAMEYDGLVYDTKHPLDAVGVKLRAGQGILERGTVLASSTGTGGDGSMVILGTAAVENETLTADCVLCDPVDTGAEAGAAVMGMAYRSGSFTTQKLKMKGDYTLTAADETALRNGGIYLSHAAI